MTEPHASPWPTTEEVRHRAGEPAGWLALDVAGPAVFIDRWRAVAYAGRRRTDLEPLYPEAVIRGLMHDIAVLHALVEDLRIKLRIHDSNLP